MRLLRGRAPYTTPPPEPEPEPPPDADYYVRFDTGSDASPGTTVDTPWKHCPGDPNATGVAAAYTPVPGDIIQFRSDVVYRGRINVKSSGAIQAPIIYRGSGWGTGRAQIAGLDTYTISATSCSGDTSVPLAVRSDQFLVFDLPAGITTEPWKVVKLDGVYLEMAQYPTPDDFWRWDDVENASNPGQWLSDAAAVKTKSVSGATYSGRSDLTLQSSLVTTALGGTDAEDLNWRTYSGHRNAVFLPVSSSYNAGTNTLTGFGMITGSTDLPAANEPFALLNHPNFLTLAGSRAGQYCTIDGRTRMIVRRSVSTPFASNVTLEISPVEVANTSLTSRTHGIYLAARTDVNVLGFDIYGQSAPPTSGAFGINCTTTAQTDLRQNIDNCHVHHINSSNGSGAGVQVRGLIQRCEAYDGWEMRGLTGVYVLDSIAQRLNYTAISLNGAYTDPLVERCYVYDIQSVHGNGITVKGTSSATLCDDAVIRNCTSYGGPRPGTLQSGTDYLYKRCVFSGGGDFDYSYGDFSQGGVYSQGAVTGLDFESCVLLSTDGDAGTLLSSTGDVNFTNSVIQGISTFGTVTFTSRTGNLFLNSAGYPGEVDGNTLDTSAATLTAARAFASATPTYDAALVTILRGGDVDPDFYVGAPNFSDVDAPVVATNPVVSGTLTVGSLLTCDPGTCTSDKYNTPFYQWFKNDIGVEGAGGPWANTWTSAGVAGDVIKCRVQHHNYDSSVTAWSNEVVLA